MFTMFDNILIIELWVGALQLDRKEPNLCEFIVFFYLFHGPLVL